MKPDRPSIHLRDATLADYPIFFEHRQDPEAMHMAAFGTRDASLEDFLARLQPSIQEGTTVLKAIEVDGEVAGSVATFVYDARTEVTYWIARSHWGRGIATEALRRMIALTSTRPLHASAAADNEASIRVLEKCGFVRTI